MTDAYASRLRALAHSQSERGLREGIYAGVRGPQYETPAEIDAVRRLGADAVGMSTVLETIAARSLGMEVLGLSLITNVTGSRTPVSHEDVLEASRKGASELARVIEGVLAAL
jgi:purine-nucleoside phosphorylase